VGVVQVQQGVVLAGQRGEGRQIGRVAGHGVDSVQADHPWRASGGAQEPPGVVDVVVAEPADHGALLPGHDGAVVDGLMGAQVDQQRPRSGQGGEDAVMDLGEGGEGKHVLGPEQLADLGLELLVERRAGDPARPARMGAPAGQVAGDAGQDLRVEVEAEVVAGGEVVEPVVPDPDPASVDLVDHRVDHGMLRDQPGHLGGELGDGVAPTVGHLGLLS
jgi:hypothetical protein